MNGKASWFCVIMACGFLVLAAVERQVYQDDLGAAVAIVGTVVLGGRGKSARSELEEARVRKLRRRRMYVRRKTLEKILSPLRDYFRKHEAGSENVPKWSDLERRRWLVRNAHELRMAVEELLLLLEASASLRAREKVRGHGGEHGSKVTQTQTEVV